MLNQALIIAGKEINESLRDGRSLVSSIFYSMMGPVIVSLVGAVKPGAIEVLVPMASIFVVVSAFSGGMNVAMDIVAGERERRSLLPLLLNPVSRMNVVVGKWLAVAAFSSAGLIINLTAFALVLSAPAMLLKIPALLSLAPLAASVEILISTWCRSTKEAHNYLSLLVFLPMFLGMLEVFVPKPFESWGWLLPILGQHIELVGQLKSWQMDMLFGATMGSAMLFLLAAGKQLKRDDVIYGN